MSLLTETRYRPLILAGLFLIVFASRAALLGEVELHRDEMWSIWEASDTSEQILSGADFTWGPLHPLFLKAWMGMVGLYPALIRFSSVLLFMPALAAVYRIASDWWDARTAWLGMLIYAALGSILHTSIQVRGYAVLVDGLPLAIWLTVRYFNRPSFKRALPLALCLAVMFYVQVNSAVAFIAIGLLTVLLYRQAIWSWWLPGVIVLPLALPEILSKLGESTDRVAGYNAGALVPIPQYIRELWAFQTGTVPAFWVVLAGLALTTLLIRRTPFSRYAWGMLVWLGLGVVAHYFLAPIYNAWNHRHSWWLTIALALLLAYGLRRLPRVGVGIISVALVVMLFAPLPLADQYAADIWAYGPLQQGFEWLQQHIRWGDVVLVDPNNPCGADATKWQYYTDAYFPNGLQYVTEPGDYSRVWYIAHDSHQDAEIYRQLTETRQPGEFFGPALCLIRLYEGPPDMQGILYENGLRFHGFEVLENSRPQLGFSTLVLHEGQTFTLRLWWSVDEPLAADYSVALHVYDDAGGALLTQSDSAPQVLDAPSETSRWESGRYYVETRQLTLPDPAPHNGFGQAYMSLYMIVYDWRDNTRFSAPGVDANGRLLLLPIFANSYTVVQ